MDSFELANGLGTINAAGFTGRVRPLLVSLASAGDHAVPLLLEELNLVLDGVAANWASEPLHTADQLVYRARSQAIQRHGATGVRRPGTGLPYASHPAEVCCILSAVCSEPELLAGAWLHDTIEDTGLTVDDLSDDMGVAVARIVEWVSQPPMPEMTVRLQRKLAFRRQLVNAPPEVQSLKAADIISNARSVRRANRQFAGTFLKEKQLDLEVLAHADPILLAAASNIIEAELRALNAF